MSKITEALKLAEEALVKANHFHDYEDELVAIREALAEQDHFAASGKVIAEPVKHESVMDYEHICALRESEQIQAGDSYFFVRPENDTPTSRKMFFQGFERGFHKGLKYAAQVSAKREWVELTDDELKAALEVHQVGLSIRIGRIAIAAFKEKNK